jgi:hypothetical protein
MSEALQKHGHERSVPSVAEADPVEVSHADLICVGSWTQGLFIISQHATRESMQFIERLGNLTGKRAVVFCTYKLATGKLLLNMEVAGAESAKPRPTRNSNRPWRRSLRTPDPAGNTVNHNSWSP